jgi:hypothetical protein
MPTDAPGPNFSPSPTPPPPLTEAQRTEALDAMLKRHVNQLAEHFSSIQIIATRLEPDGDTVKFQRGSGDWYARRGAAEYWLDQNQPARIEDSEDEE